MSDYFGRLLGISGAAAIRPRVPGLYEPTGLDDTPVTDPIESPVIDQPAIDPPGFDQPSIDSPSFERPERGTHRIAAPPPDSAPMHSPDSPMAAPTPMIELSKATAPRTLRPARELAPRPVEPPHEEREAMVVALVPAAERQRAARAERTVARPPLSEPTTWNSIVAGQQVRPPTGLTARRPVGVAPQPAPQTGSTAITELDVTSNNTASPQRQRRAGQPTAPSRPQEPNEPSEPVIRVSIGRIEVTAAAPAPAPTRRGSKPRPPTKSLASYLAERDGGRA